MTSVDAIVRAIVRDELARAFGSATSSAYTSSDLPRGVSRRSFRERCRSGTAPGARREGKLWICSREAWHASRATPAPALRLVSAQVATDDGAIAARAIEAAGLRSTRRSA